MVPWWVSWRYVGPFTYHGPWWWSGVDNLDREVICAAVVASTEPDAQDVIRRAHDDPVAVQWWRFVEAKPDDWEPFCDRFPRAEWMRWPDVPPREDRA